MYILVYSKWYIDWYNIATVYTEAYLTILGIVIGGTTSRHAYESLMSGMIIGDNDLDDMAAPLPRQVRLGG